MIRQVIDFLTMSYVAISGLKISTDELETEGRKSQIQQYCRLHLAMVARHKHWMPVVVRTDTLDTQSAYDPIPVARDTVQPSRLNGEMRYFVFFFFNLWLS